MSLDNLYQKLIAYSMSDYYPLHMPGHKRMKCGDFPEEILSLDITEIDGFDNLHQPEELLKRMQEKASVMYGSEESFYLINGSTAGILSAISTALPRGGRLLMARNCHKSVYHAAYLRNLQTSYLYPEFLVEYDIYEAVSAAEVREALKREPDIGAVIVVSPTYEGRIADIAAIAEEVHKYQIPLIVDEAHGAHLGFSKMVHENSCRLGADIVIHSTHKTLPALTQTALLHVSGSLIDRSLLRRFLRIYQSSSPSYLLMASIDNALVYLEKHGEKAYEDFVRKYRDLVRQIEHCQAIRVIPETDLSQDKGKLLVSVKGTGCTGKELYDILREKYHLQSEMAGESFVLLMFTIHDSEVGYERVRKALLEIDADLHRLEESGADEEEIPIVERVYTIADSWDAESIEVRLEESWGRIASDFVNCYPPGIPLLVPGERIHIKLVEKIKDLVCQGLTVQGISIKEKEPYIRVMVE